MDENGLHRHEDNHFVEEAAVLGEDLPDDDQEEPEGVATNQRILDLYF